MNTMKYKGYLGSIEADLEGNILYGKLLHIRDLVNYEASDVSKLQEEFEGAVDDYLADCAATEIEPDRPTKWLIYTCL